MSAHTITDGSSTYYFEFWSGDQPQQLAEQVQSFARAGAVGVAHRTLGIRGKTFQPVLESHHSSYSSARTVHNAMLALIGTVVDVVHEGINLNTAYGVSFVVESLELVECQACVRLIGPSYNYPAGARLTTRWTLTAIDKDLV